MPIMIQYVNNATKAFTKYNIFTIYNILIYQENGIGYPQLEQRLFPVIWKTIADGAFVSGIQSG